MMSKLLTGLALAYLFSGVALVMICLIVRNNVDKEREDAEQEQFLRDIQQNLEKSIKKEE